MLQKVNIYSSACEKFIPKIKLDISRKTRPPWLSRELRGMIRTKSDLWHAFMSSGKKSEEIHSKYIQAAVQVSPVINFKQHIQIRIRVGQELGQKPERSIHIH